MGAVVEPGDQPAFYLQGRGVEASGTPTSSGFLVAAGAAAREKVSPSFTRHNYTNLRDELVDRGVLRSDGERLVLSQDYEFNSPSAAAAVLLGRAANGKDEWRTVAGQTLGSFIGDHGLPDLDEPDGDLTPAPEQDFRRRWFHAVQLRLEADEAGVVNAQKRADMFASSADEALNLLDQLQATGDLSGFHQGMKQWAVKPGTLAFNGFSGQMLLNQLVKRATDTSELVTLLTDVLSVPADDREAIVKIESLVSFIETVRVGSHPAPGHVPFLLSYFWGLADHSRWPVIWASAASFIEQSTGQAFPSEPGRRYLAFVERVRELDVPYQTFENAAVWAQETSLVFLDEVLSDRAGFNRSGYRAVANRLNAGALVSLANYLGNQLNGKVEDALGRQVDVRKPGASGPEGAPRSDLWVDWVVKGAEEAVLRLWLNERGAAIGLLPLGVNALNQNEISSVLEPTKTEGYTFLGGATSRFGSIPGRDVGLNGPSGESVYGRWYDRREFAALDLADTITSISVQLQPVFDRLLSQTELSTATPKQMPSLFDGDDPLIPLVEEFLAESGYPADSDRADLADRLRFAKLLAPGHIGSADISELRLIWNTARYGRTNAMPELNRSFRGATEEEYDRMINSLEYLLWGGGDDAKRIDRVLTDDVYRISGLGEAVIMKLLAITQPDRYLAVFPYRGARGKQRMIRLLDLDPPHSGSAGQLQVDSNDRLRQRLEHLLSGDTFAISRFLYWYLRRSEEVPAEADRDLLGELAEEVMVERQFLDDIVELLKDKGQVIFYGPPGTGKTYLARKLAALLASSPRYQSLVQFHPSTSYEDFFEGYRPETGANGELTYRLTPGPLALMAERAIEAPGRRHVMIIDEINRANLPKVFGELLFLLEYRDHSVQTLYRPETEFSLPPDLWFIGTMNTADRSIALVDAALRRRFHFVPFFPNQGAMSGLLDRWLERHHEPAWVGEFVAHINDELEEALGGPHLQVGPSHFMKPGLDQQTVRRIWQYNIEPFLEDQFFGDQRQIDRFRFDDVYRRYRRHAGLDAET